MDSPETPYLEPRKSDWVRTGVYLAIACLAAVGLALWLGRRLPVLVLAGVGIVVALLVRWHAGTTGYRCPGCSHEFVIGAWADFLSPHMLSTKYVKCPKCGRRGWMEALVR